MTGLRSALLPLLALLAGALAVPGGACAQCRLCATPSTSPDQSSDSTPIKLDVQARLDFDQILLESASPGTARIAPDGSRSTSGSVAALSGRAMVGSGVVSGEPGRLVRIGFPGAIELVSPTGSTIRLSKLASDLPAAARLDSDGQLKFRFGGELDVSGNVEGNYRGDIEITVDYL